MGLRDFFSGGTKGEGWEKIPLTEEQILALEKQVGLLKASQYETFKPRKIAGLTKVERDAVAMVQKMMSKGIPGVSEAMTTVRGYMDADLSPKNIPGLKGLFAEAAELGGRLMGKTKRGLALTGNIPSASSAGKNKLGRVWQDIMDRFITAAYPFYQQFISNKLSAPERLANLGIGDVTTRTGMAMTTGAAPRTIQQQINDAILEAKRKSQLFKYDVGRPLAGDIMGQTRYAWNPGTPVGSEASVVGNIGSSIMSIMKGFGGGGSPVPTNKQALFTPGGANVLRNAWL